MDTRQKQTNTYLATDKTNTPIPYSELSPLQRRWVDFCALGGLLTDDDGTPSKMTVQDFADSHGVGRSTLYEWKTSIPNFQDLVAERCMQLFNGARTVKVVNAIYLNATAKMNAQAQAMWMANQKLIDFRMPQQKVEHELGGGISDLLERARQHNNSTTVIEGEVTDATDKAT